MHNTYKFLGFDSACTSMTIPDLATCSNALVLAKKISFLRADMIILNVHWMNRLVDCNINSANINITTGS